MVGASLRLLTAVSLVTVSLATVSLATVLIIPSLRLARNVVVACFQEASRYRPLV